MKGTTDKQGERKGGKTVSAERREEILRRIRSVMTEETPDLWEKIDRRLGPRDEAAKKVSGRRRFPAARIAAAAACLLLCVSAAAGGVLVWNHFENGLSAAGSRESDVSSAAPYLFIVYSRASASGYAGRAAARPDEPIVLLSADGHNQLGAIGDPWETEDGREYRLDIDLQFFFMGDTIESVTYTKEADGTALLLGNSSSLLIDGTAESGDAAEEKIRIQEMPDENVSFDRRTLTYTEQAEPFLFLRFPLDAAPYEELGTVDKLSAVYDAFREAIRQTALTAEIRYRDGSRDTVRLLLGIDETNTHAVTVTLQEDH